jgi:hypothetical protein
VVGYKGVCDIRSRCCLSLCYSKVSQWARILFEASSHERVEFVETGGLCFSSGFGILMLELKSVFIYNTVNWTKVIEIGKGAPPFLLASQPCPPIICDGHFDLSRY